MKIYYTDKKKYSFPCADFHKTHKCSTASDAAILYHSHPNRSKNVKIMERNSCTPLMAFTASIFTTFTITQHILAAVFCWFLSKHDEKIKRWEKFHLHPCTWYAFHWTDFHENSQLLNGITWRLTTNFPHMEWKMKKIHTKFHLHPYKYAFHYISFYKPHKCSTALYTDLRAANFIQPVRKYGN